MDYKRIIRTTGLLFCVLLLFSFSCYKDSEPSYPSNKCYWIIKNTSDSRIIICSELSLGSKEKNLNPGESYVFVVLTVYEEYDVYFDKMYEYNDNDRICNCNTIEDMVEVRNSNYTKTLKVWKESEKYNPGCQFFNEGYWTKREWKEDGYNYFEWTFELQQEDIE